MKKLGLMLVALVFSTSVFAHSRGQETAAKVIKIKTPYVKIDSTIGTATQVYMELDNHGKHNHIIESATSKIAKTVQLHHWVRRHGRLRMVPVNSINIHANADKTLQPGGFHVMLIGLKSPIKHGQTVPVTLHFKDGSHITVKAKAINV